MWSNENNWKFHQRILIYDACPRGWRNHTWKRSGGNEEVQFITPYSFPVIKWFPCFTAHGYNSFPVINCLFCKECGQFFPQVPTTIATTFMFCHVHRLPCLQYNRKDHSPKPRATHPYLVRFLSWRQGALKLRPWLLQVKVKLFLIILPLPLWMIQLVQFYA